VIQPDSAIQNRNRIGQDFEKNSTGSDVDIQTALITAVKCRDERTVKIFSPSPVLIRKIFENHQSDPVMIRPCKIMNFNQSYLAEGKIASVVLLPHEAK